jgi:hypothetical protein
MCETNESCSCHAAVTRAYHSLRGRGVRDLDAFGTATVIFRFHHPEASLTQARSVVAEWLDGGAEMYG